LVVSQSFEWDDTSTETFYFPVVIVFVAVESGDYDEESVEGEVKIDDCDSGAPDHLFYGALLRSPHGGKMPLSVVIAAAVEDADAC
jgi:hypothetical protein